MFLGAAMLGAVGFSTILCGLSVNGKRLMAASRAY